MQLVHVCCAAGRHSTGPSASESEQALLHNVECPELTSGPASTRVPRYPARWCGRCRRPRGHNLNLMLLRRSMGMPAARRGRQSSHHTCSRDGHKPKRLVPDRHAPIAVHECRHGVLVAAIPRPTLSKFLGRGKPNPTLRSTKSTGYPEIPRKGESPPALPNSWMSDARATQCCSASSS